MKTQTNLIIIIFSLLLFSCAHNFEFLKEQNYTPPSIKYQPRLMYPKNAHEESSSGVAKVVLLVSTDGTVEEVKLSESTGSDILDETSLEYCKSLIFNPAVRNNKPVKAKIEWGVQFAILDQVWDPYFYVNRIEYLYHQLELVENGESRVIQKEIINAHNKFVQNMTDALNFNIFMERVILTEVSDEWKNDWNAWPISFLLYHDFLTRFKDYDSVGVVKKQLQNALNFDLNYIRNTKITDIIEEQKKQVLIDKIKSFISSHYPDIYENTFKVDVGIEQKNYYL